MTDAFTTAAFESAASKYQGDWDAFEQEPVDDYGLSEAERRAHVAGWKAARDHLAAQEPTDSEVKAARRAFERHSIFRRKGGLGPSNCVECGHPYDARHEGLTDHAIRASLAAAKGARA